MKNIKAKAKKLLIINIVKWRYVGDICNVYIHRDKVELEILHIEVLKEKNQKNNIGNFSTNLPFSNMSNTRS